MNPIEEFAAAVESASRLGRMKLSMEQRGIDYVEDIDAQGNKYLLAMGYIIYDRHDLENYGLS